MLSTRNRNILGRSCPLLLTVALIGSASSCAGPPAEKPDRADSVGPDAYKPLYGSRDPGDRGARGTIRGDHQWAAEATTLASAASRWEEFLKRHNPPGQEYEDSMHASYAAAAQYELMRVYYLQGRRDDGDALLHRLDPVGWLK